MHETLRTYFSNKRNYKELILAAYYENLKAIKRDEHNFAIENSVHLINLEYTLLAVLSYSRIEDSQLIEAQKSLNFIITAFRQDGEKYRTFLLDMAKRAVSDIYYLFVLYAKYYLKTTLGTETLESVLINISKQINEYPDMLQVIAILTKYKKHTDRLFFKTNQKIPWEYDDYRIREFYTVNEGDKVLSSIVMSKILEKALNLKEALRKDHTFLSRYYNTDNGLSYRYSFILQSLHEKRKKGQISDAIFASFQKASLSYQELYDQFVHNGLAKFGAEMSMDYSDILEFSYKASKLIEYKYLRSSRYEQLDDFRSETLIPLEKEIVMNAV